MQESWKEIPGWEGYYSVSSLGRVKSHQRIIIENSSSKKSYTVQERILKPTLNNIGKQYWRVSLSKNSKISYRPIHQLVCAAFIGEQTKGIEVRHLNGNCQDNRLENLAYGSKSENMKDAIRHGTFPLYEQRPGSKITKEKAIEIVLSKESMTNLAKQYGVVPGCIRQIKTGETWTKITEEARKSNPYLYKKRK